MGKTARLNIQAAMEFFLRTDEEGLPSETAKFASQKALNEYSKYLNSLQPSLKENNLCEYEKKYIEVEQSLKIKKTTPSNHSTHGSPA
jgi:lysine/ornithine N-monooxygenase